MKIIIDYLFLFIFLFFLTWTPEIHSRSPHRAPDSRTPRITVAWQDTKKKYTLTSPYLRYYPLFGTFDLDFFNKHFLPQGTLSYRYHPEQSVDTKILTNLIDQLLEERKDSENYKKFKHFTVLQDKDYNIKTCCGPLILKFNDYPFVVKIFQETPRSLTQPLHKSFEELFFFYMNGSGRHYTGFTRIKNLENVKKLIQSHPIWSSRIDFPRKWYWVPKGNVWITIHGKNFGSPQEHTIHIPSTYCIVADKIECEKKFSKYNCTEKKIALNFCNFSEQLIDAHIDNFMIEKQTNKLVIVDTEHFPTVVGFKGPHCFYNYFSWYRHLASKAIKDTFFTSKREWLKPEHHQARYQ